MAALTTLAIIGLVGYAAGKTIEAKKANDALQQQNAPAPTALGGGALPRGTAAPATPANPMPPDTSLASQNATIAAQQAANKQRQRAIAGNNLQLGTPGASTPPARLQAKTLLGSY